MIKKLYNELRRPIHILALTESRIEKRIQGINEEIDELKNRIPNDDVIIKILTLKKEREYYNDLLNKKNDPDYHNGFTDGQTIEIEAFIAGIVIATLFKKLK